MVRKKKNEQQIFCCECCEADVHQPVLMAGYKRACMLCMPVCSAAHMDKRVRAHLFGSLLPLPALPPLPPQTTVTGSSRMSKHLCSTRKQPTLSAQVSVCVCVGSACLSLAQ